MICVSGVGAGAGFSALMTDKTPNLHLIDTGQCFPLYLYEKTDNKFFSNDKPGLTRRYAISDNGLAYYQSRYPNTLINKEDLFYYIYGLLHSEQYKARFKNNLTKQLPRIPAVKHYRDFQAFSEAGRTLGDLHVNFEDAEPYMVTFEEGDHRLIHEVQNNPQSFYRVTKWKPSKPDKSTVKYNPNITIQNIPPEAYDYVVNGKPALNWVMEWQAIRTHTASTIINDANDYAIETMKDPQYPLTLFRQVITISLQTLKIIDTLPELNPEDCS